MPVKTKRLGTFDVTITQAGSPPSGGNALADAAQGLAAGSSVNFPIPTYAAISGLAGDGLDWNIRITWDATALRGHLMYKPANQDNNFKYLQYDAATNVWTNPHSGAFPVGGGTGSGHGYDNSAVDPATGVYYYVPLYAENVIRWTGSTWVVATGNVTGGTGTASTARNITWHPNLYGPGDGGLVTARSSGRVRAWRKSTGDSGSWVAITGTMPYTSVADTQGVYCSALDQAILSCGTTGLACLRVVPGASPSVVVNQQPFPVPVTSNSDSGDANMSRLVATPSGSVAVLQSESPYSVWRLNTSTFEWELQSYTHPLRNINSSWPTAFVSNYGIYWALRESVSDGSATPNSLLWRPPVGL